MKRLYGPPGHGPRLNFGQLFVNRDNRNLGNGWGSSSDSDSDEEREAHRTFYGEAPEIATGRKILTDGDCKIKIVSKVFNDR